MDFIRVAGSPDVLRVVHVGFMNTKLMNRHNTEEYIMPNDTLETAQVVNMSKGNTDYRVFVFVGVDHGTDTKKVTEILKKVASESERTVKDRPVRVHVTDVGASSINFRLAVYVDDVESFDKIAGELRELVNNEFAKNGINIPFPQLQVNFDNIDTDKGAA